MCPDFIVSPTVCGLCKINKTVSKSESGDGAQQEDGSQAQDGKSRAIHKATLKLDWILGDDPSQIVIPGSPPAMDRPAFFADGEPVEMGHVVLETIEEKDEMAPAKETQRHPSVATWPRIRQIFNNRRPIADFSGSEFSGSTSNGLDSGASKSGSVETALSVVTTDGSLPKISDQETVDKGTQTDCSIVEVHTSVEEGRLGNITYIRTPALHTQFLANTISPHASIPFYLCKCISSYRETRWVMVARRAGLWIERSGVNLIKNLQVSFTSVFVVSEVKNNSCSCKLHL